MGILRMAWMFMTPIMYSLEEQVPAQYHTLFYINPMTSIVEAYRAIMYSGGVPRLDTLGIAAGMGIVFLVLGFLIFGKLKKRFSEVM